MKYFVFLFLSLGFSLISIKAAVPDSLIQLEAEQELSAADAFDSLYFHAFQNQNQKSFPSFNPYGYAPDSIPVYSDSVLSRRIQELNIHSPFHFVLNEEVRNFILYFSGKKRGYIGRALARADFYFPLFEELLDKYNLPQELKYLSVVESALNPVARSRAGAVGLWQFMPSTGRMYGLTFNSKIDKRKNMWEATEAACRHFVDLYNIYQDWNLVLAAYNAGPGNVNRAIKRSDSAGGYWQIYNYLPQETRGYVPAFIAVNYLMNYPAAHNIQIFEPEEKNLSHLDTLMVREKLTFNEISTMAEIDYQELKDLNPHFTKKYIPATSKKPMCLTLPLDNLALFIRYRRDFVALEDN